MAEGHKDNICLGCMRYMCKDGEADTMAEGHKDEGMT
jgi:hypothetical protein